MVFRTGTPKLKTLKGFTWASALELVKEFLPDYVRQTWDIAKDKLLADRDAEEMLSRMAKCGMQVVQDEAFLCRTQERRYQRMIREVSKPPKVALCRECHGTGFQKASIDGTLTRVRCPQCEGAAGCW